MSSLCALSPKSRLKSRLKTVGEWPQAKLLPTVLGNTLTEDSFFTYLCTVQAAFAASHKICIRYLKGEDPNVQLMYLGSVSVVGAVLLCIMTQQWSVPSASSEWVLLVVTGQVIADKLTNITQSAQHINGVWY